MSYVVMQPFYDWKGHYKKYTDAVFSACSERKRHLLLAGVNGSVDSAAICWGGVGDCGWRFVVYRILNPLLCIAFFVRFAKSRKVDKLIVIEFNPLSYLLLSVVTRLLGVQYTQVIHNFSPPSTAAGRLRRLYLFFVRLSVRFDLGNSNLIVHNLLDFEYLLSCRKKGGRYLEYPTEGALLSDFSPRDSGHSFAYVGMFRDDKDYHGLAKLCEQLSSAFPEAKFYIWGYPKDIPSQRLEALFSSIPNLDLRLEYVADNDIHTMLGRAKYFMLPYYNSHLTVVGPAKLAMSYGLVSIASESPMFEYQCVPNGAVLPYFYNADELVSFLSANEWSPLLSNEILAYAKGNCWEVFSARLIAV